MQTTLKDLILIVKQILDSDFYNLISDNWKNEFGRWCPQLRVFVYYGTTEERRQFRFDLAKGLFADFDVILTT